MLCITGRKSNGLLIPVDPLPLGVDPVDKVLHVDSGFHQVRHSGDLAYVQQLGGTAFPTEGVTDARRILQATILQGEPEEKDVFNYYFIDRRKTITKKRRKKNLRIN